MTGASPIIHDDGASRSEPGESVLTGDKEIPHHRTSPESKRPMITSKMTAKAQTAIPQAVRVALRLGPGDELATIEARHADRLGAVSAPVLDEIVAAVRRYLGGV
jgi:bifunctional DNA-binding transcriptional regulator/antitoxin component of YhaV-PrlF toxin-antitoxin module